MEEPYVVVLIDVGQGGGKAYNWPTEEGAVIFAHRQSKSGFKTVVFRPDKTVVTSFDAVIKEPSKKIRATYGIGRELQAEAAARKVKEAKRLTRKKVN